MSRYQFRLYIAGSTPSSQCAVTDMRRLGEEHLHGDYELDIVDVLEKPSIAETEHIFVTPTLVRLSPSPERRICGNLSDWKAVCSELELAEPQPPCTAPFTPDAPRIRGILDIVSEAVIVLDEDSHVCFVNPAAEKLFGQTETEFLARPFDFPVTAGQSSNVDIPRADGVRTAEMFASEIIWDDRSATVIRFRDVTDRQNAQSDLKNALARLDSAQEHLQRIEQIKNRFYATLSHDIRTPISEAIGLTGLLLETSLDATQQHYARDIRNSIENQLSLINDILDYSKIDAGQLELENLPFELMICIDEAIDMIRRRATEKGLELCCEVKGNLPCMLVGDATRLRQILINLLSNAVKFTDSGTIVVTVVGKRLDDNRHELYFSVHDTGIGISVDQWDELFQPYRQADFSSMRVVGGTGLGLAISKRLAEMMGGSLWAESDGIPGKGAAFHFTIVAAEAAVPAVSDLQERGFEFLADKHIVVMDDDASRGRDFASQLARWAPKTVASESVRRVIRWISKKYPIDAIVLDMPLPVTGKPSLVGKLLNATTAKHIPVIALTSRFETVENKAIAMQLVKPVSHERLCDALCNLFDARLQRWPDKAKTYVDESSTDLDQHLRILLAEDSPVNQKVTQMMLNKIGYRADLVSNGIEAVRASEAIDYDVIFMDCQMPEMDGYEATRLIRQREEAEHHNPVHIIAMTAMSMEGDRQRCLAAGMDEYLVKPVRAHALRQALERFQAARLVSYN